MRKPRLRRIAKIYDAMVALAEDMDWLRGWEPSEVEQHGRRWIFVAWERWER